MQQYILRLHIPMHDVMAADNLECLHQLNNIIDYHLQLKFILTFENVFEGASIAELIDEIVVVGCFEHVQVANYVR